MTNLRKLINTIDSIDHNTQLNEGVNEAWTFAGSSGKTPDGLAIEDQLDRDFTGRAAYNSSDNGYFDGEKTQWGTWKKKHKKWPQYDLYSTDGGKTYSGNWTGRSQGAKSNDIPNTKNNGWMAIVDLVDAEETTGGLLMPPNLVDTAGMRSKNQGLGYSNSPSMQAKRAMQFAQQMGLKDWNPKQGFDVVANYIPYALHVSPGERFKDQNGDKQVRVPVNLFSDAERADIAKARWSGSNSSNVSIGGYSLFHPDAPQNGVGLEDEEDKDIVLGQPRKQAPGSTNKPAASSGGVFAADAATTTPVEKVKTIPVDPKVKAMQEEIMAKDPAALKFGADGKLGPETARAMAKYPDIARKYMGIVMTTGVSIKSAVRDVAKGIRDFGKDIWNSITNESDNNIRTLIDRLDQIDDKKG